jgi:hypothetical protein
MGRTALTTIVMSLLFGSSERLDHLFSEMDLLQSGSKL